MGSISTADELVDILTIDAQGLKALLDCGVISTQNLVKQYLAQIQRHEHKLHAMIQTTPENLLVARAALLDQERAAGKTRGPLHGIPIVIKDNIATHPSLGLPSSAGSLSLLHCKPRRNAKIIDQLLDAGLIILGKANLAEFANIRSTEMHNGWSAVGGQTQPAYVRDGIDPEDSKEGHSNPSGSSTGSAVAVAAGYAPLAIGTETDGSLVVPSGRAALYTIKPTIGLVSQDGIIPISSTFDAAGPMTKSPYDLAALMDIIASTKPAEPYTSRLTKSWSDISVACLDPEKWKLSEEDVKPVAGAEAQIVREIRQAYDTIKSKTKKFVENVDLVSIDEFTLDGVNSEEVIMLTDLKRDMKAYLEDLEVSEVRSLADVIEYNIKHADLELPPEHPSQDLFLKAQEMNTSPEEYAGHLAHLRKMSRDQGVEKILKEHGVDVIIGPTDSGLTSMASASGFPLCAMPLSYLDYNGRPFGVSAIAGRNQEALLIKVMSAWEATFPARKPPPHIVQSSS